MSSFKKFMTMFAVGFPVGIIFCTLITVIMGMASSNGEPIHYCANELIERFGSEGLAVLVQSAVSGVYGGICIGATVVYDMERWSLLKATAFHCVVTLILYYGTGIYLHWFRVSDITENVITFVVFVSVYVCIWLVNYVRSRIEVNKFNEELEKLKKEQ